MPEVILHCDDCDGPINNVPDAELAWAASDKKRASLRVVHVPYACKRWKNKLSCLPVDIKGRGTHPLACYVLHVSGYEEYRRRRQKDLVNHSESELPASPDQATFLAYLDKFKGAAEDDE